MQNPYHKIPKLLGYLNCKNPQLLSCFNTKRLITVLVVKSLNT
jgi:hypothetical protein